MKAPVRLFVAHALALTIIADSAMAKVVPDKELMITDLQVIEDPVRTTGCGVWTFCALMTSLADGQDASDFTLSWLRNWKVDRTIRGFTIRARPRVQQLIINSWPRLSNGKLDLTKAPFRLLAIVNRIDLRTTSTTDSGEGRFVFGVLDSSGRPEQMTVIFEFKLLNSVKSLQEWADDWHALGSFAIGSPAYNKKLEAITNAFSQTKIADRPNRSALGQVRTNEIFLEAPWEMREFIISSTSHKLVMTTVKLTPDDSVARTAALRDYINENEDKILAGTNRIKEPIALTGASLAPSDWDAEGILNPKARHLFALNTCNGCHSSETSTGFLHISNRELGATPTLSFFFQNIQVQDGRGALRNFNELGRRKLNFNALLDILHPSTSSGAAAEDSEGAAGLTPQQILEMTNTPPNRAH